MFADVCVSLGGSRRAFELRWRCHRSQRCRFLTAWTNAQAGDTLIFRFPSDLPRELDGTPFYGIDIANGCLHPESAFKDFGRVKTIRLFHNGKALFVIHLADSPRWQHVTFPDVYLSIGDTLAIEVLETYPGRKEATAAISEIVLQGAH
jgi:hypothetical protein